MHFGKIPYTVTLVNDKLHEEAKARLEHIAWTKRCLCRRLTTLTDPSRSHMFLRSAARNHALACMEEIIDDLFHDETLFAQGTIETYERRDYRKAIQEWDI